MRRRPIEELIPFDPEIERTLHRRRRQNQEKMGDPKPLRDYAQPSIAGISGGIQPPRVEANGFEIKTGIISILSTHYCFRGLPSEDPHAHIHQFNQVCDTFKIPGVSGDVIRLKCFPFTLKDKALDWLNSVPSNTLTTWDEVAKKFLAKFFPPAKIAKMRMELNNFAQYEGESLSETWERFNELQRKCPYHQIPKWMLVQNFYNGCGASTRTLLDAASGGAFNNKDENEAWTLLEQMSENSYQWPTERITQKKVAAVQERDALAAEVRALTQLFSKSGVLNVNPNQTAHFDEGSQFVDEQVNYVAGQNRNYQYGNNYNPNWRHPNLAWNNQNVLNPSQNQPRNEQTKESELKEMMVKMMEKVDSIVEDNKDTKIRLANQEAAIKNLEFQMGKLAQKMNERATGTWPSTTEDPREVKAVHTRSGRVFEEREKSLVSDLNHKTETKKGSPSKPSSIFPREENVISSLSGDKNQRYEEDLKIPYPQALKQHKYDKQYRKFIEMFKRLHVNIPFADALAHMPKYARFMKDVLSNKKKLEDFETVALTEECSAVLQKKLPPKLKDPGSFSIPCNIGNCLETRALCDLGASINLMPLSMFRKLGIGEVSPTTISLQLADRSVKHPRGVVEDVLVKVDKFIFPADFVVLDMEEDSEIPLILGRPFLATGRALIDVQKGELTLRVQGEEVSFHVFKAIKCPESVESCFSIQTVDSSVNQAQIKKEDPFEQCVFGEDDDGDVEMGKASWLCFPNPRKKTCGRDRWTFKDPP